MLVRKEYDFDFRNDCWGGAKDRINSLTDDLIDKLESYLDDSSLWSEEVPTETEVNNFIWFEDDTYAEWFGFDSSFQMWEYCELVNDGIDEDEIWKDETLGLVSESELRSNFDIYMSENPDWADYYDGFEDWAEDNGYEKFEI